MGAGVLAAAAFGIYGPDLRATDPLALFSLATPALLTALGFWQRLTPSVRLVLLCLAGLCLGLAGDFAPLWPLAQLAFLLPAVVGIFWDRSLRPSRRLLRRGRLDPWPIAAIGGAAAVALPAWVLLLDPDLTSVATQLPAASLPLLILGFVGFSLINALLEEVLFRGLFQGALQERWGSVVLTLLLPSLLFGTSHYHGVPSGIIGATLAGGWALLLGWARRRSAGLLTPILAHAVADAAIFLLVIGSRDGSITM